MRRALRGLRARLRDALLRGAADREMDEELRFHVDMETEKYLAQGLDPAEARRRALAAFGGVERHRARLRDGRRVPLLEPLWHDLRFGVASLVREPGTSLVAMATIALGVGATTVVFSTANGMLLRPLPIPGIERMVVLEESRNGMVSSGIEGMLIPYERYMAFREAAGDVVASLAAHRLVDAFSLRLPEATVAVGGALTSGNYFQTLGVRPELGRAYSADDADEIVLSHELWVSRFDADPAVVGRTVGLDGHSVVVVGVAPAGFGGATFVADEVWAPIGLRGEGRKGWDTRVAPLGRLRDGMSIESASSVVDAIARRIPPEEGTTVTSARLEPLRAVPTEARGYLRGFLGMLLGMALLVLLIAAANVAGVMLARGLARRREMAVRLALGAGRARIVRHLLAESLLLSAVGGLAGVGLAYLGAAWLSALPLPPQAPDLRFTFTPDRLVLAFALAVAGTTGVLFGLVPALRASRPDLVPALKTGTAGSVGGDGALRNVFVGGQVALAVTLLLTAMLFARSLRAGLSADVGFDPQGMIAATVSVGGDAERGRAFQEALLERVRALPGVEAAAWAQYVPLSGGRSNGDVRRPDAPGAPRTNASYNIVTPGYFETMRIPIVAGRGFTPADAEGAERAVIVNQTLADRMWPGASPLGHRLTGVVGDAVVVGVTAAGRYAFVTEPPTPFAYLAAPQHYRPTMALHARAPGAEAETLRALGAIVHDMDPDIAVKLPLRLRDLVGTSVFPQRFAAQLVGAFGLVGLILAALGIYGVLAYQVSRRTRELGVRRALGATAGQVTWLVLYRGALVSGAGCLVGVAAGAALARAARSFLFGVRPLDPVTFTAVPLLLFAVALLASWLPASRASSVEASEALRGE